MGAAILPRLFNFLDLSPGERERGGRESQSYGELGPSKGVEDFRPVAPWLWCSIYVRIPNPESKQNSAVQSGWYEPEKLLMPSLYLVSLGQICDLIAVVS